MTGQPESGASGNFLDRGLFYGGLVTNWFYAKDGQQLGPVSNDELKQLAKSGQVQPTDLVWTEGMANWQPVHTVADLFLGPAPLDMASPPSSHPAEIPLAGDSLQQLAQSQAPMYSGQAPYGAPGTLGYYTPQQNMMPYAGFWWRFLAVFIDGIILRVGQFIVDFGLKEMLDVVGAHPLATVISSTLIGLTINWLYDALQESSAAQATIGKRICGIRVTDLYGQRISFGRATGRHFGKLISTLILFVGYLMQPFTGKRQALHDIMAGTLILKP